MKHCSPNILSVLFAISILLFCSGAASQTPSSADSEISAKTVFTLEDCLKRSVAKSSEIEVAKMEAEIQEYERKSMRGNYFPKVSLDARIVKFNDPVYLDVDLSFLSVLLQDFLPMLSPETLAQLGAMQEEGLQLKVRDDLIYEAGVTVVQPLTQLYRISAGDRARKALAVAARREGISVQRKIELQVVKAYAGLVAAVSMEKTIASALVQLDAMEKQVQGYLDAELVERNALLKVRVARAQYQKNLFSAQKGADMARAALNMLMDRPLTASLEPSSDMTVRLQKKDIDASLSVQQKEAVDSRPELESARAKVEAAKYAQKATAGKMIPELSLVFRYHNTQGTGQMQPENELFGGLILTWDIWDWGVDYYETQAAKSRYRKAQTQVSNAEDMIRLDVQSKWLELQEARKSVEVSEKQAELADENLRIEQMRYDANEATTSDLLEAQTLQLKAANDLIIARINVDAALYSLAVARGLDLVQTN